MDDDRGGFTPDERKTLRALSTPAKVQDCINALPWNAAKGNNTCMSPRLVMQSGRAQCVEGAMFAAAALRAHGFPPLVLDLMAAEPDADHVLAVFRQYGRWGAISKTNHAVLRYREPVYRTLRELCMSYFHEYFLQSNGRKTLRSYGGPINLSRFDRQGWMTSEKPIWYVPEALVDVPHVPLVTSAQVRALRPAETIERQAGEIVEWP